MKWSEFEANLERDAGLLRNGIISAEEYGARVVELCEKAGGWSPTWEPEEPELPKMISFGLLIGLGPALLTTSGEIIRNTGVYRLAARRYNAYPELEALARELALDIEYWVEGFRDCEELTYSGLMESLNLLNRSRDRGLLPKD